MRANVLLAALIACSSASKDSAPPALEGSFPRDLSESGITDWIAADKHRDAPWVAETSAPRPANAATSPHGRVQVWFNDVLAESQAAGNGEMGGSAHPTGAMVVKELYDDTDVRIGQAVMLKLDGPADAWGYWCDADASRCGDGMETTPMYGVGLDTDCGFCHGGLVFNTL